MASKDKILLHPASMAKVANGSCAHFSELLAGLAEQANKMNAAICSTSFGFIDKDEPVSAKYVPEITVTVRTPSD